MTAYQIHPTGPCGESQENLYTDTSLSNLFNVVANQINSTRQVLWQRYTAMLLANSLVFGLLIRVDEIEQRCGPGSIELTQVDQRVMGATAGIVLCSFWILIFVIDWWTFHYHRLGVASRYEWTQLPSEANPFKAMMQEKGGLVAYFLALSVALLFLIINILIRYQNV